MTGMDDMTPAFRRTLFRLVKAAAFAIAASAVAIAQSSAQVGAQPEPQIQRPGLQLPEVHLDANGLSPRPIEELTGTTIARHYALAWRDLALDLESDQADGLGDEFVGFAKDRLTQRINEQKQTGMHVRIVDHGHYLKAVFYSIDGTAMQLIDRVQLEIQTFDGDKLVNTQNSPHDYMVLITPGSDRWYVRDLQEVSAKLF
jgi:hypothetical protein